MSRIGWDKTGEKKFETGLDHGVIYPINTEGKYTPGAPWNGLTNINEKPTGAEVTDLYADNIKYASLQSAEKFEATLEAFTYPKEFEACDGSADIAPGATIGQQSRKIFGLSYRTLIGNDVDGQEHGYKLHLIYGCLASPSEKSRQTVNESPEAATMSWEIKTTPVNVNINGNFKPTATLVIDSTQVNDEAKMKAIEDALYGTEEKDPVLLLPDEVAAILAVG